MFPMLPFFSAKITSLRRKLRSKRTSTLHMHGVFLFPIPTFSLYSLGPRLGPFNRDHSAPRKVHSLFRGAATLSDSAKVKGHQNALFEGFGPPLPAFFTFYEFPQHDPVSPPLPFDKNCPFPPPFPPTSPSDNVDGSIIRGTLPSFHFLFFLLPSIVPPPQTTFPPLAPLAPMANMGP